jgi:hypothetical protein
LRPDLALDVRRGSLFSFDEEDGQLTDRWTGIELAVQGRKPGVVDWDTEWADHVALRERNQLPPRKGYTRILEDNIKQRWGVARVDGSELRRFIAALYRRDADRPKRAERGRKAKAPISR